MSVADIVIHIDEELDPVRREDLVESIRTVSGVIAPRFNPGKEHLLFVAFDPDGTKSTDLLDNIKKHGYHAQLIGL